MYIYIKWERDIGSKQLQCYIYIFNIVSIAVTAAVAADIYKRLPRLLPLTHISIFVCNLKKQEAWMRPALPKHGLRFLTMERRKRSCTAYDSIGSCKRVQTWKKHTGTEERGIWTGYGTDGRTDTHTIFWWSIRELDSPTRRATGKCQECWYNKKRGGEGRRWGQTDRSFLATRFRALEILEDFIDIMIHEMYIA